jgi:hypothetical protein
MVLILDFSVAARTMQGYSLASDSGLVGRGGAGLVPGSGLGFWSLRARMLARLIG